VHDFPRLVVFVPNALVLLSGCNLYIKAKGRKEKRSAACHEISNIKNQHPIIGQVLYILPDLRKNNTDNQ
jgi:hypothetical protein